jgi:hypothetical protein
MKEFVMKKQLLWVIILPLLILSCYTVGNFKGGTIYDESVPLEESALISQVMGTITGYNGITVNWKTVMGKAGLIQIPAGDTLLEVDVDSAPGNTRYIGKGMIFQYNFQAGKYYYLSPGRDRETGDVGVHIYSWSQGEKVGVLSENNYEAFAPFLNAEGNTGTGTTVLE